MAPNVTADDSKNVVVGATEYMEYNVEGTDEWLTYNPEILQNLMGTRLYTYDIKAK